MLKKHQLNDRDLDRIAELIDGIQNNAWKIVTSQPETAHARDGIITSCYGLRGILNTPDKKAGAADSPGYAASGNDHNGGDAA
jgi:hypothetical protein